MQQGKSRVDPCELVSIPISMYLLVSTRMPLRSQLLNPESYASVGFTYSKTEMAGCRPHQLIGRGRVNGLACVSLLRGLIPREHMLR